MKPIKTLDVKYIILHGAKKEKDRKKTVVNSFEKACEVFNEKQMKEHVSVYRETTETVVERIFETE